VDCGVPSGHNREKNRPPGAGIEASHPAALHDGRNMMTLPKTTISLAMLILTGALAGCSTSGQSGGSGGRFLPLPSAQAPATSPAGLIGKLNGGLIGQGIDRALEPEERRLALEAEYHALEEAPGGEATTWQSPDRAVSGKVVAAPPYQVGSQNCRQYTHTVTINGTAREARGAACRNDDGSWTPLT
jgi:surface antigen